MPGAEDTTAALAAITQRDPGFDVQAFLSTASSAFLLVDQARREGRPELVTTEVSPQARGAVGLDGPAGNGVAPMLGEPEVVAASTGAVDAVTVRFHSRRGQDRSVDDWTFQRPSTAVTASAGDTCPQCGARDSRQPNGKCRFCGATITATAWAVARATSVDPLTSATADRTGAELARTLAEIMAASGAASRPSGRRRRSALGCGCGLLFWGTGLLVVAGIASTVTAWFFPDSPVHAPVAKVIAGVRRAHIDGTLTVTSGVHAAVPLSFFHSHLGHCSDLQLQTSTFVVDGPASGGTVSVRVASKSVGFAGANRVNVTASFDQTVPSAAHQAWSPTLAGGTVSFTMAGDGSGEATFTNLPPTLTSGPQETFSATLRWTCKDK